MRTSAAQPHGLPNRHPLQTTQVDEPMRDYVQPIGRKLARHYGFHPFPGRKDPGVVQAYIRHYTQPDQTVLDVFGGGGVTAREALILRRRAIVMDINPVAELVTRASVLPVDLEKLDSAFQTIAREVAERILAIDEMPAAEIERTLGEYDLSFLSGEIHTLIRRGAARGIRHLIDLHDPRQLLGLLLLRDAIRAEADDRIRLMLRVAFSHTLKYATRMFKAKRTGYWAGDSSVFQHFAYVVPETLSYKNVWLIFEHVFANVRKGKAEAQRLIGDFYQEGETFSFIRGSALNLQQELAARGLPANEFADYCITDPPYAEVIQYPLLFSIWYAWLDVEAAALEQDLTVPTRSESARREGISEEFVRKLTASIGAISRALRTGGWLTLFYQHSNLSYWKAIVEGAGEYDLRYVNLVPQPQNVKSFAQVKHPFKAIAGTLMLNLRKLPASVHEAIYGRPENRILFPSLHKFAELELQRVIVEYLGAPTDVIAYHVIPALLNPNLVSGKVQEAVDLIELIREQDLEPLGAEHVPNGEKDLWMLKPGVEIDPALDFYDRLRYHLFAFLRRQKEATQLELHATASEMIASEPHRMQTKLFELAPLLSEFAELQDGNWHYSPEARRRAVQMRLLLARSSADELRPVFFQADTALLPLRMQGLSELSSRYSQAVDRPLSGEYRTLQNLLVAVLTTIRDRFSSQLTSVSAIGPLAEGIVDLRNLELEDLSLGLISHSSIEDAVQLETTLAKEVFGRVFLNSGIMFTGLVRPLEHSSWLRTGNHITLLGQE
ncbi:hypothetical protein BH23GEM7_BH23GEM7_28750 [soil metagenome]